MNPFDRGNLHLSLHAFNDTSEFQRTAARSLFELEIGMSALCACTTSSFQTGICLDADCPRYRDWSSNVRYRLSNWNHILIGNAPILFDNFLWEAAFRPRYETKVVPYHPTDEAHYMMYDLLELRLLFTDIHSSVRSSVEFAAFPASTLRVSHSSQSYLPKFYKINRCLTSIRLLIQHLTFPNISLLVNLIPA